MFNLVAAPQRTQNSFYLCAQTPDFVRRDETEESIREIVPDKIDRLDLDIELDRSHRVYDTCILTIGVENRN